MKFRAWANLRHELWEMEERFFERGVEHVLRIKYPKLVQPPARQGLDRKGIDLVSRSGRGKIDIVVQCKGFGVTIPSKDQTNQAISSIDTFLKSDEKSKLYIFVHNRDARASEFTEAVKIKLAELVPA